MASQLSLVVLLCLVASCYASSAAMQAIINKFSSSATLKPLSIGLRRTLNCSEVGLTDVDMSTEGLAELHAIKIHGLDQIKQDPPFVGDLPNTRTTKGDDKDKEYMAQLSGNLTLPGLFLDSTLNINYRYGQHENFGEVKLVAVTEHNPLNVFYKLTYIESLKRLVIRELRFEPHLELYFDATGEGMFAPYENCVLNKGREAFGVVETTLINFIKKALVKAVAAS